MPDDQAEKPTIPSCRSHAMLQFVSGCSRRTCEGLRRRDFLQIGTLGLGGLQLPSLLEARAEAALNGGGAKETSVVLLFLTGGPAQIETFDPKMTASAEYRSVTGEVTSRIPGVSLGGTFPGLARLADRLAIVRSFTHDTSDHTKAVEQVMRGGNPIGQTSMGAVTARLSGISRGQSGMPAHVYLSSQEVDRQFDKERLRLLAAAGAGTLGGQFGPFPVGGDSELNSDMQLGITRARLDDRLAINRALDRMSRQIDATGAMSVLDEYQQQALELVLGTSRSAFDLSQEDPRLVQRYDTSRFLTGITTQHPSSLGHQMMLARRLCEAGCGFVTIHNAGWDMHGGDTQYAMQDGMEKLGRPVDHAVSAFLEDVRDRGLSDRILLIITGEFGRTPRLSSNGGRDHWPRLSTLAFAGGGLRMGQVIGRSTPKAEEPQSDPVTLDHLFATVLRVLFDLPALRQHAALPRTIASLMQRSQPIRELF